MDEMWRPDDTPNFLAAAFCHESGAWRKRGMDVDISWYYSLSCCCFLDAMCWGVTNMEWTRISGNTHIYATASYMLLDVKDIVRMWKSGDTPNLLLLLLAFHESGGNIGNGHANLETLFILPRISGKNRTNMIICSCYSFSWCCSLPAMNLLERIWNRRENLIKLISQVAVTCLWYSSSSCCCSLLSMNQVEAKRENSKEQPWNSGDMPLFLATPSLLFSQVKRK